MNRILIQTGHSAVLRALAIATVLSLAAPQVALSQGRPDPLPADRNLYKSPDGYIPVDPNAWLKAVDTVTQAAKDINAKLSKTLCPSKELVQAVVNLRAALDELTIQYTRMVYAVDKSGKSYFKGNAHVPYMNSLDNADKPVRADESALGELQRNCKDKLSTPPLKYDTPTPNPTPAIKSTSAAPIKLDTPVTPVTQKPSYAKAPLVETKPASSTPQAYEKPVSDRPSYGTAPLVETKPAPIRGIALPTTKPETFVVPGKASPTAAAPVCPVGQKLIVVAGKSVCSGAALPAVT